MSEYDKIPRVECDWDKPVKDVIEQWMDGYFAVQLFAAERIHKYNMMKITATAGWVLFAISTFVHLVKP